MTANNESLVRLALAVITEIDALVDESDGVYGLHRNGDVAPWSEVLSGGRFERLTSVESLREALAQQSPAVKESLTDAEQKEGDAAIRLCDAMGAVESVLSRIRTQSEAARVPVMGEPVAWVIYTKIGKEWKAHPRLFSSREEAQESIIHFSDQENTEIRALFLRPSNSVTQEEMDGLRRDAGRYRWLRDDAWVGSANVEDDAGSFFQEYSGEKMDVAIDRAMQETK